LLFCLALLAGLASPASAELALSGQVGTLGVQGQVSFPMGKHFAGRIGVGALPRWSISTDVSNLNFDYDMSLYTVGAFLDWHPMAGGFRITGGVIFNSSDINADVSPAADQSFKIGDHTYPGYALGKLNSKAEFNPIAPYLGIGYNGAFYAQDRLSFTCDVGVMFWGAPDISLSSNRSSVVPGLKKDLQREEEELENNLDFLQYYPVASMGVSWAF
jgi:hypothetical protein